MCEEAKKTRRCVHARVRACTSACACTSALRAAFLDHGPHRGLLFIFSLIEMECCRGQDPSLSPLSPPDLATGASPVRPKVWTSSAHFQRARDQVQINLSRRLNAASLFTSSSSGLASSLPRRDAVISQLAADATAIERSFDSIVMSGQTRDPLPPRSVRSIAERLAHF